MCCGAFGLSTQVENFTVANFLIANGAYNAIHNILHIGKTSQMFFTTIKKWERFVVQTTIYQSGVKFVGSFAWTVNGK